MRQDTGARSYKGTEASVLEKFPAEEKDTGSNVHREVPRTATAAWAKGSGFREASK